MKWKGIQPIINLNQKIYHKGISGVAGLRYDYAKNAIALNNNIFVDEGLEHRRI